MKVLINVKSELPDGSRSLIHDAVELVSFHITTGKQASISVLHIQYVNMAYMVIHRLCGP